MRITPLLSTVLLSSTLGAMAFAAKARDQGAYSGVGVGQTHVDEGSYNDRDGAFSVVGGYDFNKYVGVEAGYADLGRLEYVGAVPRSGKWTSTSPRCRPWSASSLLVQRRFRAATAHLPR